MKLLEDRIRKDGVIQEGNVLKVDSFLNHQMDIDLINEIGKEFFRRFSDAGVSKILTIEASGIGIACIAAQYFHVPVVFAKKNKTKNIAGDVFTAKVESFTHGKIPGTDRIRAQVRAGQRHPGSSSGKTGVKRYKDGAVKAHQ